MVDINGSSMSGQDNHFPGLIYSMSRVCPFKLVNFVYPHGGVRTQTIESRWIQVNKMMRREGVKNYYLMYISFYFMVEKKFMNAVTLKQNYSL